MSFPPGTEIFQFPGFASPHYVFMWRYPKGVGCPIRTSTDQRLLAAPRGFSQRATSFIASWCQGIHRMPFSRSRYAPGHISGGLHHAQKPSSAFVNQKSWSPTARLVLLIADHSCSAHNSRHLNDDLLAGGRPMKDSTSGQTCEQARPETHQNLIHPDKDRRLDPRHQRHRNSIPRSSGQNHSMPITFASPRYTLSTRH
jgi:hypothetical protein